jgi:hypothetical protein
MQNIIHDQNPAYKHIQTTSAAVSYQLMALSPTSGMDSCSLKAHQGFKVIGFGAGKAAPSNAMMTTTVSNRFNKDITNTAQGVP